MGVETILLIVILAFAAGFVLDRLAVRRGRFDAAKSKKEQYVTLPARRTRRVDSLATSHPCPCASWQVPGPPFLWLFLWRVGVHLATGCAWTVDICSPQR